jgi:hypothetical protein
MSVGMMPAAISKACNAHLALGPSNVGTQAIFLAQHSQTFQ